MLLVLLDGSQEFFGILIGLEMVSDRFNQSVDSCSECRLQITRMKGTVEICRFQGFNSCKGSRREKCIDRRGEKTEEYQR